MSTGFRLFLLILFGFGAIFAYRYRSVELHRWLRAQPAEPQAPGPGLSIASPVNRVLDADVSWAWLLGSARPVEATGAESAPQPLEEPAGTALDEEVSLEVADLPVSEDLETGGDVVPPGDEAGSGAPPPAEEAPGSPPPPLSGTIEKVYRVELGDSLWKIAARTLGSGKRYREILEWNRELFERVSPDLLPAGTQLKIRLPAAQENLKAP